MWSINAEKDDPSLGEDRKFQRLDENCIIGDSYNLSTQHIMDVQFEDRKNDVQVVPDFSDLLKTIADDINEKSRLQCTTEYEPQTFTEGLFPRNYHAIDNDNTTSRDSETDELGIYLNETLLTPQPVERLFSTLGTEPSEVFRFPSPPVSENEKIVPQSGKAQGNFDFVSFASTVSTPDIDAVGRLEINSLRNGCRTTEVDLGLQKQEPFASFPAREANVSVNIETDEFAHHRVSLVQEYSGEDDENNNIASSHNETKSSPNKLKSTIYAGQDFTVHEEGKRRNCQAHENILPTNTASWEYGTSTVLSSSLMDDFLDRSDKGTEYRFRQPEKGHAPEKKSSEMEHSQEYSHSKIDQSVSFDLWGSPASSCPTPSYLDEITKNESEFGCDTEEKLDRTIHWDGIERPSVIDLPRELKKIRPESGHASGLFPGQRKDFPPNVLTPAPPSFGHSITFPPLLVTNQINAGSVEEEFALKISEVAECKQTGGEENSIKHNEHSIQRCYTDNLAEHFNSQDNVLQALMRGNDAVKEMHDQSRNQEQTTENVLLSEENSGLNSRQYARQVTSDKSSNNDPDKTLRTVHNKCEKQRRLSMKNRFESLRRAIPELAWKTRAPKILILSKARGYIADLTTYGTYMEKVIAEEKERNRVLFKRLQKVMTHWNPAS